MKIVLVRTFVVLTRNTEHIAIGKDKRDGGKNKLPWSICYANT